MSDQKIFLILIVFLSLTGCSTIGVESENYKATILYFEGGGGQIKQGNDNFLINRSSHHFPPQGIKLTYMNFNFTYPGKEATQARYTMKHFHKIQERVDRLIEKGHRHIWLMGISNGCLSVIHAGSRQIQDVEGLIVINPNHRAFRGEIRMIELPLLAITHEKDSSPLRTSSDDDFKRICPSSANPKLVLFSGGRTSTGPEATALSQKFQHGLRGLERPFSAEVVDFIFSNSE